MPSLSDLTTASRVNDKSCNSLQSRPKTLKADTMIKLSRKLKHVHAFIKDRKDKDADHIGMDEMLGFCNRSHCVLQL